MTTASALASAERYTRCAHACAAGVIRGYSTSFAMATRLLPPTVRRDISSVYALVRVADEVVDGAAEGAGLDLDRAGARLDALEADVARATEEGFSENMVVHAFADVARRTGIPGDVVTPFFTSMRTDLTRSVHDDASFTEYVYGSAEVVGLMCLHAFFGDAGLPVAHREQLVTGARRLGAAFQKVNFLRDLDADADALERAYFPGVDPARLDEPTKQRLVRDIDDDLAAAAEAIPLLPRGVRPAVQVAHDLFAALNRRIRNTGADVVRSSRIRVPDTTKVAIAARAMARHRWGRRS
ncbi:phytoene/squalene synthase family protein [Tessaracoccus antarcticus]|uniref:phytoene/squalene synthase family protein n=1 Tax=Tessaracoccus antarcticus TaxID=2479848 RepID=UPI0018F3BBE3|nr:squalene/phytoene synthase family protein [Tessaracoccus antarcticus]